MRETDTLTLRRYSDNNGNFTIFCRLLDNNGYGIQSSISIIFEDEIYSLNTDENGIGVFRVPKIIPIEYSGIIIATVSGLKKNARLKIERKKVITSKKYSLKWFIYTYNGRATLFILIMILAWIYCGIIGFGSSIWESTFGNGLSRQEEINNRIAIEYGYQPQFVAPDLETWQHKYWLIAFLWSIFTIFYFIYAMIKTTYYVMINWIEDLSDSSEAVVNKELFNMAALWTGAFDKVAKNDHSVNRETEINFWSIVKANLLSELLAVLGGRILKQFFK